MRYALLIMILIIFFFYFLGLLSYPSLLPFFFVYAGWPFEQPGCAILHLVLHYFLLTNYAWMLCEGFYLHTVLVSAFISEQRLVRWLMGFGWTSPAVVLILYGSLRRFHGDKEHTIQWVIYNDVLLHAHLNAISWHIHKYFKMRTCRRVVSQVVNVIKISLTLLLCPGHNYIYL